jgi:hypothetical protein
MTGTNKARYESGLLSMVIQWSLAGCMKSVLGGANSADLTQQNSTQTKNPVPFGTGFSYLVEPSGIEPLTSTLPVLRSPS